MAGQRRQLTHDFCLRQSRWELTKTQQQVRELHNVSRLVTKAPVAMGGVGALTISSRVNRNSRLASNSLLENQSVVGCKPEPALALESQCAGPGLPFSLLTCSLRFRCKNRHKASTALPHVHRKDLTPTAIESLCKQGSASKMHKDVPRSCTIGQPRGDMCALSGRSACVRSRVQGVF